MADVPQLPVEPRESPRMALVSNALAIIGFIILFVIIVWGIFHIVSLSGNSIGGLFGGKPSVTITAPKTAPSGEPMAISWKYSGNEAGTFSFLYQCQQNFAFETGPSNALSRIPCGSAIPVGSSTSATIVPVSSASSNVSVPVTVVFVPKTGTRTEGSVTISITPNAGTGTSVTPPKGDTTTGTTKPTVKRPTSSKPAPAVKKPLNLVAHAASGPADLAIKIIMIGVIDQSSGTLLPRAPISPNEIVGVEFDIANIGGSASGNWVFSAQLPTGPQSYSYLSPKQISLLPGEHIVNVLRFAPNMRGGQISIIVDPQGLVLEENRNNNSLLQTI